MTVTAKADYGTVLEKIKKTGKEVGLWADTRLLRLSLSGRLPGYLREGSRETSLEIVL